MYLLLKRSLNISIRVNKPILSRGRVVPEQDPKFLINLHQSETRPEPDTLQPESKIFSSLDEL